MPLTDMFIRGLKADGIARKHTDGGGLYLYVSPTGGRLWRLDYRFAGKRKTLSLGAYPSVSLKAARLKREEARAMLAEGIDPGVKKQEAKALAAAAREQAATKDAILRCALPMSSGTGCGRPITVRSFGTSAGRLWSGGQTS